eukprot:1257709-Alexandrium_andersonii.AAC.1
MPTLFDCACGPLLWVGPDGPEPSGDVNASQRMAGKDPTAPPKTAILENSEGICKKGARCKE